MINSFSSLKLAESSLVVSETGKFYSETGLSADVFCAISTIHALAHLVLAEKAAHFFHSSGSRDFVENELPKVLARLYPNKTATNQAPARGSVLPAE